ncbi:MAG: MFS transporter [Gammaproteobacteria bacterium]|nr:MFS transporter [Gammaproteobacteria bacterium]
MAMNKKTLFCYSVTDLPASMAVFPIMVFVPKFYTGEMGVSLALAANIILVARIFDVITDPLVGYLSDRTHTRWGRRRPWILAAAPVLMLAFFNLFLPPEGAGAAHLFTWMMVLSVGTTMLMIPYYSWAAELSPDYNERSRITGWRSFMGVVGTLSAQLVPVIALLAFGYGGTGAVLSVVGWLTLFLLPLCIGVTVWNVPETRDYVSSRVPLGEGFKLMWRNGPFKRLIAAFTIGSIAFAIATPLYIFYIAFVLGAEDMAVIMLAFFFSANLAGISFWVWLSSKVGKHRAYVGCFTLIALANPAYLLLGPGDFWWMMPITLVSGFAAGGFAALPNSMKADVVDLDTLKSGNNRTASFFAAWSFTAKMSASLGSWIALSVLAWIGFDASPDAINPPAQILGLKLLFALLPSTFFLLAAALVWNYPITEVRHQRLRSALERRRDRAIARNAGRQADLDSAPNPAWSPAPGRV